MSKRRTLLVDGNWNLKRNYHQQVPKLDSNKENCNGVYGFLISLQVAITKIVPDRVIVFWDGFHAGKLRYEIYKPYKAKRKKHWDNEEEALRLEMHNQDEEGRKKFELLIQKIKTMNFLGDLWVRQLEMDHIEADDLIGQYILTNPDEEITIFSRDKDFYQLISDKVSVLSPDQKQVITGKNFKQIFGHGLENQLLFRCFEGDDSDEITGVNGITRDTLIKYFPLIAEEKYTFKRLVEESYLIKEKKKNKSCKTFDKIINSHDILYRNAMLMNLKKPFVTARAIEEVEKISKLPLDNDRSIRRVMLSLTTDGYMKFFQQENISLEFFFSIFHRIQSKEKEYEKSLNDKNA